MKDSIKELLSRILDEDISEFEAQRILKEINSNDELGLTLQRYDLIGHAMRKELPKQFNQNFVHNISSKLINEEMEIPSPGHREVIETTNGFNRFKTAVGFAIAASVAVFSFVAFQNIFQPDVNTTPNAIVADQIVEQTDIQRVSSEDLQNFISNPKAAASFNSYIMNHAEYASPRVSVPHVRIVGYGKDGLEERN
ncbi:MAG: sigma-E factor negative regulatory protein [Pseudomonadota bacterium]